MTPTHATRIALAFLFAGCAAGGARAEDWQDTHHTTLIDVDSILRGATGWSRSLRSKSITTKKTARTRRVRPRSIAQSGSPIPRTRCEYESDWRAKGAKVIPGTMGEQLLDFVCSRVR